MLKEMPTGSDEMQDNNDELRRRVMAFINQYKIYKNDLFHTAEIAGYKSEPDMLLPFKNQL
jgi:hypothetical protein